MLPTASGPKAPTHHGLRLSYSARAVQPARTDTDRGLVGSAVKKSLQTVFCSLDNDIKVNRLKTIPSFPHIIFRHRHYKRFSKDSSKTLRLTSCKRVA